VGPTPDGPPVCYCWVSVCRETMTTLVERHATWLLAALGALIFLPFLGNVHLFDWDEINFAEAAREMIVTGDYLRVHIDYEPFWEKPPLFLWMQVLSMKLFGINEFAARLPNALCGILSLVVLYRMGRQLVNHQMGLFWALAYLGSILPHFYFKSGIIDPWFNFFIFLGLYYFMLAVWQTAGLVLTPGVDDDLRLRHSKTFYLVASGISIGLAVMTKGPVGLLIPLLCIGVYYLLRRWSYILADVRELAQLAFFLSALVAVYLVVLTNVGAIDYQFGTTQYIALGAAALYSLYYALRAVQVLLPWYRMLLWLAIVVGTISIWYGVEIAQNGTWFATEFLKYQVRLLSTEDAGHGGFPGYHVVVLLLGCFPASILALRAFGRVPEPSFYRRDARLWMVILFGVVLVLFSLIKTKIVHYSSLAYFPLTFLAALAVDRHLRGSDTWKAWQTAALLALGLLLGAVFSALPFVMQNKDTLLIPNIADPFARANLTAPVEWTGSEALPGIILLTALGLWWWNRRQGKAYQAFGVLLLGSTLAIYGLISMVTPRVEPYSQGGAIRFYEEMVGKNVYIRPYGYKSYAHLFYAQTQPGGHPERRNMDWLLHGNIDRDVYIVAKIKDREKLDAEPNLKFVEERAGYLLYHRPVLK